MSTERKEKKHLICHREAVFFLVFRWILVARLSKIFQKWVFVVCVFTLFYKSALNNMSPNKLSVTWYSVRSTKNVTLVCYLVLLFNRTRTNIKLSSFLIFLILVLKQCKKWCYFIFLFSLTFEITYYFKISSNLKTFFIGITSFFATIYLNLDLL